MKTKQHLLLLITLMSMSCIVCACGQTSKSDTKTADNSTAQKSDASNNSASMVSTVIDGHEIKVDTNNPNMVMIDGQKVNVAFSSMSKDSIPESMKNGKAYTSVVNGKKVTAYHKFICPKPGDAKK